MQRFRCLFPAQAFATTAALPAGKSTEPATAPPPVGELLSGPLYDALAEETGHTVLIKASWLRIRAQTWTKETSAEPAFLRRQDLPAEAIMTLSELNKIRHTNTSQQFISKSDINQWRLPIVAVS